MILEPREPEIGVGETVQFSARAVAADGSVVDANLRWTGHGGVEVTETGLATGTYRDRTASVTVEVLLGPGDATLVNVIEPSKTWRSLAGGDMHTCGLVSAGRAYCEGFWGSTRWRQVTTIRPGRAFRSITSGGSHICALTEDGTAFCWGLGGAGQLGNGGTASSFYEAVAVSGGQRFREISAGDDHVCGLTGAGQAYCWGDERASSPVPVTTDLRFTALASRGPSSCAIATDAKVYCWYVSLPPTARLPHPPFTALGGGYSRGCGLDADGAAWCWQGVESMRAEAIGHRFVQLAVGESHACGLSGDGRASCWGTGADGQLGDGHFESRATPVEVAGGHRFVSLTAGSRHTCGVAEDGRGWCWGRGIVTESSSAVPLLVVPP